MTRRSGCSRSTTPIETPATPLFLTGFMGAGKTTVGRLLATRLGRPFLDLDQEIERRHGSIPAIFATEGEAGFRRIEADILRALGERYATDRPVIALGGGTLCHPPNRCYVERIGLLIYLRARPETILDRLGEAADRPLLAGLSPPERRRAIERRLASRAPQYERASIVIPTDRLPPSGVVSRLLRRLGTSPHR